MDPRLLRYYNRELQFVREMGGEFAAHYPKIAGRLGLEGFECADPYVERLLEGFAFLAARVQLKLDVQYPAFTQHLLEMIYPHYLQPIPSMAVVQFQPDLNDAGLGEGHLLPRDTALRSLLGKDDRTACQFRTAQEVSLWPLQLTGAKYFDTPAALAAADVAIPAAKKVRAGLRLQFAITAGVQANALALDRLPVFIAGADALPKCLYEQLLGNTVGYVVRARGSKGMVVGEYAGRDLQPRGFANEEALIPYGRRSFSGYRLLQEFFACPQRFLFVEFTQLRRTLQRAEAEVFEIVVLFDRSVASLHNAVDASNFRLFCAPAINLFPKAADRIHLTPGRAEYHILADRTRPMDFEVHSVSGVEGFGDGQEPEQTFQPFYGCDERSWHNGQAAYYSIRREPRLLSTRQKQRGARSSYIGSELFISLADRNDAPYATQLRQLGMQLLCTNRDLPLTMPVGKSQTDFTLEEGAPVESVRCVAGPTKPRSAANGGNTPWRLLSHLQLNYVSLLEDGDDTGAAALREMLTLYCDEYDSTSLRLIEGIKAVSARPVVRRIPVSGPITFGRGLEITLTCDDDAFEGTGAFLLGAVLQDFFARYAAINSFTETVLCTLERNEVARWPARLGKRPIL